MGLLWACLNCIGLTEPVELNPLNCARLSSICSEIELTESLVFDFVRLPNSIVLNPRIEFD